MRNWIAKNAQSNRGIDVAGDLIPLFEICERVTLGSLCFHCSHSERSRGIRWENPGSFRALVRLRFASLGMTRLVGSLGWRRSTRKLWMRAFADNLVRYNDH